MSYLLTLELFFVVVVRFNMKYSLIMTKKGLEILSIAQVNSKITETYTSRFDLYESGKAASCAYFM